MPEQATSVETFVDHLFRHTAGKMVSVLARIFGLHNLDLAEDVVQEAFLKAMQVWRFNPIPPNPEAWLMLTARNKAIDAVRRQKFLTEFSSDISHLLKSEYSALSTVDELFLDDGIADSQLRMIFTCCHPALSPEEQIALTLRTISGFGIPEIANALQTTTAAINKRLYRAKQFIKEENLQFEIPAASELPPRLGTVYTVLYLLFNEGYNSTKGDSYIRKDLCAESIRLCLLLAEHPVGDQPTTYALLALMCFHASRFDSRIDDDDSIILLEEQDRSKWDQNLIQRGIAYVQKAAFGDEVSEYHIEAAIASIHSLSPRFEETDWTSILELYDFLLTRKATPMVLLNRAIVVAQLRSPEEGIEEILKIDRIEEQLKTHYLFDAVLGDLYLRYGETEKAREYLRIAEKLTTSSAKKKLIKKKLTGLDSRRG